MTNPDFSTITSLADARRLADDGRLVKILLFPAELGGEDVPPNVLYIPPEAAAARSLAVGTLVRLAQDGSIDNMTAAPEYRGASFVPVRIVFNTSRGGSPGAFQSTIEIW